ncbi:MAG: hypothetical protein AAGA48_39030 [Myxococcota bacterium]
MQILTILGLAWSGAAFGAEPLFVPSFTPNTPDEAALARQLEQAVVAQLQKDGHIVIDAGVASTVVPPSAIDRCAVLPTCPSEVLPQLPARFSVVARIDRLSDGTILGHVEYYQTARKEAIRITDASVARDEGQPFAEEVARTTAEVIGETGPSTDAMRDAARKLIADAKTPAPAAPSPAPEAPSEAPPDLPTETPTPEPTEDPKTEETKPEMMAGPRGDGSEPHTLPIDELIAGTSVKRRYLIGAERHFKKSGLDPRDYMYVATPHAGRVTIEVRAGFGSGDINRQARLRAEVTDAEQTNAWYREGPAAGQSFRGELVVGYAPATFIDIGVLFGLQYGERIVTNGVYTTFAESDQVEQRSSRADETLSLNVYLQPRLRVFLVPFGPAKPFLVGGVEVRFFDGYPIAQPEEVTYLLPESGFVPGGVFGGGMMIDAGPIVGLFAEATYTRHFGLRSAPFEDTSVGPWDYTESPFNATDSATIAINGGVQFRL